MDRTGPRSVYNHEKSAFAKPSQTEYLMTLHLKNTTRVELRSEEAHTTTSTLSMQSLIMVRASYDSVAFATQVHLQNKNKNVVRCLRNFTN